MYEPSNIKSPGGPDKVAYIGAFGKRQYEAIAERLVELSQQEGEWVSLSAESFVPGTFDELWRAESDLEIMATSGYLSITKDGFFELTQTAIKVLAENYPSGK